MTAAKVAPQVDPGKCEGKGTCVVVCPYNVFVVSVLPPESRRELGFLARLKGFAHGWTTSQVLLPDACHACGLCVKSCPEEAISLRPREAHPVR